jgi:hypothetical protein
MKPEPFGSFEPPSLAQASGAIAEIKGLDLTRCTIDEIADRLGPLIQGYTVTAPVFTEPLQLFRARNLPVGPPAFVSQMLYPPANMCEIGRANREGVPVLYCSAGLAPVFFELGAKVGTRLAILQFETAGRLVLNRVGYTQATFERLRSSRSVPDYGVLDASSYSDVGKLVNDFLAEIFCEPVPDDERWR